MQRAQQTGGDGLEGALEHRYRAQIETHTHTGRPGHLHQVAEEPEPGHVGTGRSTMPSQRHGRRSTRSPHRRDCTFDPPTLKLDEIGQGSPYATYGFGAQIAEVEVDIALGTVKVLRMAAAHDVGRVINPSQAEGQVHGGIAQGLGFALMEEYLQGVTENLHDYLIPTVGDMPTIETIFVEDPEPLGPYGAKGLGEHALIPTAPAILGGIYHATGARITRVPATPDRVREALLQQGRA